MAACTTKQKLAPPGGQQQATSGPGGATSGQQYSFQQSLKQAAGPASHGSGKGAQQGTRSFTPTRAVFSTGGFGHQDHRGATGVIGASSGFRVEGFRVEGVAVDEKEKCYLGDLSVPGGAVMSACPATAILNSGSGISTMSESVAAKLQAAVPDV